MVDRIIANIYNKTIINIHQRYTLNIHKRDRLKPIILFLTIMKFL